MKRDVYIIGDIHGHYSHLIALLFRANLIKQDLTWIGEQSTLCFVGDYTDRGAEGLKVIDFLISLQIQAEMHGGEVITLVGNHDMLIMAAHRFGDLPVTESGESFDMFWKENGGVQADADGLTPEHIAWLTHLPAMIHLGNVLVAHADSWLYTRYGDSVETVNQAFERIMRCYDRHEWYRLLVGFNEHEAFYGEDGATHARDFLRIYGGERFIHGHTPIDKMTGEPPELIRAPLIYADGLCINVDGGIYRGGMGFIYKLP